MMKLYAIRHLISKHVWDRGGKIMGRVYDYRISRRRLSGLVMDSKKDSFYNPWISSDGTYFCDCQGHEGTNNICSHIMGILKKADFEGDNVQPFINGLLKVDEEEEMTEIIYETQLKCYNDLFGGLRTGQVSGVVSAPEVGKSYLIATLMVDMLKNHGKNALIIDTEGGFTKSWIDNIAKRYGLDDYEIVNIRWWVGVDNQTSSDTQTLFPITNTEKVNDDGKVTKKASFDYKKFQLPEETNKPTIFIYNARHTVQIPPFLGRPQIYKIKGGVIEPSEGGHLTSIWDSPIGLLVEKRNIGFVALDSISSPIESFFTGGQINFRTRAKAEQVILGRAQDLVDEYPVVFMVTVHATIQHNNPHARPGHVGGKAILHNTKWVLYIEKYGGKKVAKKAGINWRNLRSMQIYRHPKKTPWSEITYCQTTDSGIEDFDRNQYVSGNEPDEDNEDDE